MPTEREAVHQYLRLKYHLATGFILPDDLCPDCARQAFAFFANLESLDELLAEPVHSCRHHLTAVTIMNTALQGPAELIEIIGEDLATYGWNGSPGLDEPLSAGPEICH